MTRLLALAIVLGGCCPPPTAPHPHDGSGSGAGSGSASPVVNACDAVHGKVEQLYRADAQAKEPKRVDDATADNVAMVMNDCGKAPDRIAACLATAESTADIETKCLAPLDEEGTEGDLAKHHP